MSEPLESHVATFEADVETTHNIVHGDDATEVATDNGPVRSFAKLQKDLVDDLNAADTIAETQQNRDEAQQFRNEAEAARDAASVAGEVYADTTAGLAATSDGQYFKTPAAGSDGFLTLYRNDAGAATEIETFPSLGGLTAAIRADNEKTTRLNRSFSQRPFAGESLRADFEAQAYGLGDTAGISRAVGESDMFTVQRATTKWVFQPVSGGAIQLVEVPIDTLAHEWDPVTREYLGVLMEGVRTNSLTDNTFRVAFSSSVWERAGNVLDGGLVVGGAPDGGDSRKVSLVGDTSHQIEHPLASPLEVGKSYMLSCWVKGPNNGAGFQLGYYDGSDIHVAAAASPSNLIETAPGGWFRYAYEVVPTAVLTTPRIRLLGYSVGSDGDEYEIFAPQLEEGDFTTSPIITGASAVTRAADSSPRPLAGEFNTTEGALFVEFSGSEGESFTRLVELSKAGSNTAARIQRDGATNGIALLVRSDDSSIYNIYTPGKDSFLSGGRAALSFGPVSCEFAYNGVSSVSKEAFPFADELETLSFGHSVNNGYRGKVYIKRIRYIPKFLTATELEAMTA